MPAVSTESTDNETSHVVRRLQQRSRRSLCSRKSGNIVSITANIRVNWQSIVRRKHQIAYDLLMSGGHGNWQTKVNAISVSCFITTIKTVSISCNWTDQQLLFTYKMALFTSHSHSFVCGWSIVIKFMYLTDIYLAINWWKKTAKYACRFLEIPVFLGIVLLCRTCIHLFAQVQVI